MRTNPVRILSFPGHPSASGYRYDGGEEEGDSDDDGEMSFDEARRKAMDMRDLPATQPDIEGASEFPAGCEPFIAVEGALDARNQIYLQQHGD